MSMNTALPEEADGFMRGVFMPPQAIVGRYCCAQSTNPDNYRSLVGDVKKEESAHGGAYQPTVSEV